MVDSEHMQEVIAGSRDRVLRRREILRVRRFGINNDRLPYPLINLNPSQQRLFQKAVARQARKEQMGLASGNAGSAAMMGMAAAKGQQDGRDVRPDDAATAGPPEGRLPAGV